LYKIIDEDVAQWCPENFFYKIVRPRSPSSSAFWMVREKKATEKKASYWQDLEESSPLVSWFSQGPKLCEFGTWQMAALTLTLLGCSPLRDSANPGTPPRLGSHPETSAGGSGQSPCTYYVQYNSHFPIRRISRELGKT